MGRFQTENLYSCEHSFALFVVIGATAIVRARRDSSSSGDGEGEEEEGLMDGDQNGVVPAINLPQGWK